MTKRETLEAMGREDSVVFDNPEYDDAIIGVTEEGNVVYDYEKMINILAERDEMSRLEAAEFIDFNTVRAIPYAPDPKPIIMYHLWE
jgi:hypothetical protein